MKRRLLIVFSSLIVLAGIGAIAWYLIASLVVSEVANTNSSGVSDQEEVVQPSKTEIKSAEMPGNVPSTTDAEVIDIATEMPDQATEEAMLVETQTSQIQPTPTEPRATESQPTEPQTSEVEPPTTQPTEIQLTVETQPTATQLGELQPTVAPSVEVQEIEPQPTEVSPSETEPAEDALVVIRQGQFKDADNVHQGTGTATIYQRSDGSYLLSFENFAVCCGPDLYVFLANNPSPASHADLGDYLELSSLKSSTGNQEYEISADTDLSQINSIVIYCKPFQVIISTAKLG